MKKRLTSWLPHNQDTKYTTSVPEQNGMHTDLGNFFGQVALQYATSSTLAATTQSQDPRREAHRIHKRDLSFLYFLGEQDLYYFIVSRHYSLR